MCHRSGCWNDLSELFRNRKWANRSIRQAIKIDCLADIGEALGNFENRLWEMKNGYALVSHQRIERDFESPSGIK